MKLEELNKQKAKILEDLRNVNGRIEELELQEQLPALKKQYEGRYFKYQNSYSSERKWWMYVRCVKVVDTRHAVVDYFESADDGDTFKLGYETGFYLFQVPIRKAEWDRELKKFKKAIEKL